MALDYYYIATLINEFVTSLKHGSSKVGLARWLSI